MVERGNRCRYRKRLVPYPLLWRFIVAIVVIAVSGQVLYLLSPSFVMESPSPQDLGLLSDSVLTQVCPEPVERFLFLTLSVFSPLCAWFITLQAQRLGGLPGAPFRFPIRNDPPLGRGGQEHRRMADGSKQERQRGLIDSLSGRVRWYAGKAVWGMSMALPLGVSWLLFYPFLNSGFIEIVLGLYEVFPFSITVPPLAIGAALLGALAWVLTGPCCVDRRVGGWKPWGVFLSALALSILAWRLFGIDRVTLDQTWYVSMDAALYALSQVVGGRTLLVDLPSQYGLFPEFLAPLFRGIGLSVFTVSGVFALLQALSLAALFAVLRRYIKHSGLLILSGLALVTITFGTSGHFAGADDPYFQYWPIRFFWPAVSLWVFARFAAAPTLVHGAWVSLAAALGLLWNLDTGLAIWAAYGGWLGFRVLGTLFPRVMGGRADFPGDSQKGIARCSGVFGRSGGPSAANGERVRTGRHWVYLGAAGLHLGITLAAGLCFFGLLQAKADGPIDLGWVTSYQGIFYRLGFMMIPLPWHPHPWMSVLAIYLLGLLYAFDPWSQGRPGARADLVGFLSLLGIGLFAYYQGRSHVGNLVSVCWPALLIVVILADEALRSVRGRLVPRLYAALPVAGLSLIILAAGSFVFHIPLMLREVVRTYQHWNVPASPLVREEVSFITANGRPGERCLILARRQGIYYIQTGLVSPMRGPGLIEGLTKADDRRLVSAIQQGQPHCLFLGVGNQSAVGLALPLSRILDRYEVTHRSPGGTMLHLVPRFAVPVRTSSPEPSPARG